MQFMIAPKQGGKQPTFGFCFGHGSIAVPLNNFVRESSFMEIVSVPVGERQEGQHFRIGRMALL